jgi:cyclopropane fatty-acyl-phospholipid synthase-like methyltransferase
MFNVVNHVLHRQQIGAFFESCSKLLEDGGTFVFDCFNEDAVKKEKPQPYVRGVASQIAGASYRIISTPTFNEGTASLKLENEVDVYNLDEVVDQFTYRLDHIIWSQRFFKELIKKHQMKVEKILSNEEDREATEEDYKIRFVCKK